MTVREFIKKLLDEVENLDSPIDFYIYAEQETLKQIIADDGCLDDFQDVERIEDDADGVHVHLKDIEY